jgi:hypothetical protein
LVKGIYKTRQKGTVLMKKNVAIILIIVAVVLCSCPALLGGIYSLSILSSPELIPMAIANGGMSKDPRIIDASLMIYRVLSGCVICLGVIIPVVVGVITFRMTRKNEAAQTPPPQ